jgi:hypothetical protein
LHSDFIRSRANELLIRTVAATVFDVCLFDHFAWRRAAFLGDQGKGTPKFIARLLAIPFRKLCEENPSAVMYGE